jgi:hypothetical protein
MINLYRGLADTAIVMGDNGSTPLWISEDGDYGLTPITIFDAHHWSAKDFEDLDASPAHERVKLARIITDETHAAHENQVQHFLDEVRDRATQLGVRMFLLTSEGMDELL